MKDPKDLKFFEDKKHETKYEPKRNLHTELKYFELLNWTPREVPGQENFIILAMAKNSDETYVAIRDTDTKKEYIEKVVLTPSGEDIKVAPVGINDDMEWKSAMEFFVKMGIIQSRASKWRWNTRKDLEPGDKYKPLVI